MAVYNGSLYIEEQIDSILSMMSSEDELVISYEESRDNTFEIISQYAKQDKRVRVIVDIGHSVESNFNHAVENCRGEYIFLADQDDIWINNKIDKMVAYMEENREIVVLICDGFITDKNLKEKIGLFEFYRTSTNSLKNLIKGSYLGCQMMFRSEIKELIFPVSVMPPLPHDLWLGVLGAYYGRVELYAEKLIKHRIHEDNYSNTSKMSFSRILKNRMYFVLKYLERTVTNRKQLKKHLGR